MSLSPFSTRIHLTEFDRWSHEADLVIDMSYETKEDYLVRKAQIVKARYQDHADGTHRLKINPKPSPEEDVHHPMSPLIEEGGVFVFPSIHRALSRARRRSKRKEVRLAEPIPTPFAGINEMIHMGGFPAASCTAIVGSRGGMKSHLAYYTLLRFLMEKPQERALLISLRDDEDAARQTLHEILANQLDEKGNPFAGITGLVKADRQLTEYLVQDRLEVLFFWPGYISPDEFIHLVQVAVDRRVRGADGKKVSLVVVNGLEQLNARFPLCACENMFVSGLATLLTFCGTTNIIVSGGDPALPPATGGVPAGLLQMADLVLESSFQLLPRREVWTEEVWTRPQWSKEQIHAVLSHKQYQRDPALSDIEPHVVYSVIREPGARECRRRALFYMGRKGDPHPLKEGSVEVCPLPDNFAYGKRI